MHACQRSLFDPLEESAAQTGPEGQNSTLIDALHSSKLSDCVDSDKVPVSPLHAMPAQCTSVHFAVRFGFKAELTCSDACAGPRAGACR